MKKTFKRVLSIVLCAVMLIGIVPFSGLGLNLTAQAATEIGGKCGDNLTWSLNKTKNKLTISGNGEMYDYGYDTPWDEYTHLIKTIKIDNGVTSIGTFAFSWCVRLTSITIPGSVTSIAYGAFSNCSSLTSVTIGNGVTSIGDFAFYGCSSLTSITVGSNNSVYSSDNYGVLFNKNKTTLFQYPMGNKRTSYTIPNSVTSIEWYAFENCSSLKSITIPNSVTSIDIGAFEGCSSLKSITIPNSVMWIGEYSFSSCSKLTSVTIGNSVTSIDDGAFEGCSSLTSVTIPNSVKSIGDDAFYGCSGLTSVTIPSSVTSIGYGAFGECDKLADVYYNGTKAKWNKISIDDYNECLTNATIHYNSTGGATEPAIKTPSKTSINYGDSIVLHVDEAIIPAGGYVEWSANNDNFTYSVSSDGKTCTVTSESSGKTTFTATVFDKKGKKVSSGTQEMTSKAGFFQKFAAFFKKLFGLLVTYPQSL